MLQSSRLGYNHDVKAFGYHEIMCSSEQSLFEPVTLYFRPYMSQVLS